MEEVVNILIWAAMIQGFLLGLLYILSKKHESRANKILGLFLWAFVLEGFTIVPFGNLGSYSTHGYFTLPEVKLLFPLLFMHYVFEKLGCTEGYIRFLKVHYVAVLAPLLITLLNVVLFALSNQSIYDLLSFSLIEKAFMTMQYYAFALTVIGIFLTVYETRKYMRYVQSTYTDMNMLQIRWLWQLIFGIMPIAILWGIELYTIAMYGHGSSERVSMLWMMIVVFIYFISYKAFLHKNLFENVSLAPEIAGDQDYEIEKIPDAQDEQLGSQLSSLMNTHQYYLRQDLTIYDLSKEVDISPRIISETVNGIFHKNFSEWVNTFRVEDAKEKLKDPSFHHLSIEGIGFESGFKSRSAMYASFKKLAGVNPGHFRNE